MQECNVSEGETLLMFWGWAEGTRSESKVDVSMSGSSSSTVLGVSSQSYFLSSYFSPSSSQVADCNYYTRRLQASALDGQLAVRIFEACSPCIYLFIIAKGF